MDGTWGNFGEARGGAGKTACWSTVSSHCTSRRTVVYRPAASMTDRPECVNNKLTRCLWWPEMIE